MKPTKTVLTILAIVFILLAVASCWGNAKYLSKSVGLPEQAKSHAFIVGMFVTPVMFLSAGVACGVWAVTLKR